jgi:hypothetical protein
VWSEIFPNADDGSITVGHLLSEEAPGEVTRETSGLSRVRDRRSSGRDHRAVVRNALTA